MKTIFLLSFLVASSLLYSQQCYKSEGENSVTLIVSEDKQFYFAYTPENGGFFGESVKLDDKDNENKIFTTTVEDFVYKVIDDNQINVLTKFLIRKNKLFKYKCDNGDEEAYNRFFEWYYRF